MLVPFKGKPNANDAKGIAFYPYMFYFTSQKKVE